MINACPGRNIQSCETSTDWPGARKVKDPSPEAAASSRTYFTYIKHVNIVLLYTCMRPHIQPNEVGTKSRYMANQEIVRGPPGQRTARLVENLKGLVTSVDDSRSQYQVVYTGDRVWTWIDW